MTSLKRSQTLRTFRSVMMQLLIPTNDLSELQLSNRCVSIKQPQRNLRHLVICLVLQWAKLHCMHRCQIDSANRYQFTPKKIKDQLEILVRVARAFADLQSAAKADIDNRIILARRRRLEHLSPVLETGAQPLYHRRRNSLFEDYLIHHAGTWPIDSSTS